MDQGNDIPFLLIFPPKLFNNIVSVHVYRYNTRRH